MAMDRARANHPFASEGWLRLKYRDEFRSPEDPNISSVISDLVSPNRSAEQTNERSEMSAKALSEQKVRFQSQAALNRIDEWIATGVA